jgi:tetratricopeptide (TPR) repeat protein
MLAPPAAHANIAVFIADFTNRTGDSSFDSALEGVTKLALEQAAFISAFDSGQANNLGVAADNADKDNADGIALSDGIDELEAQTIAQRQGIGFFVSGSLEQQDSRYVIAMKARESVSGKTLYEDTATAASKDKVLTATTNLAAAVRAALGDDTSDSTQRFAMEKLSATTLEAVREYATAMELLSNGDHPAALKHFTNATELDKDFGLAWTGRAVTSRNVGELESAEKYMETALAKIDRMTEREKYRTRAYSFSLRGNRAKCIEEYGELIRRFPADIAAHNNRAGCFSQMRDLKAAIEEQKPAVDILPNRPLYRNNLAVFLAYGGVFEEAEKEVRKVQTLDPAYDTSFVVLAFSLLGQGKTGEALDTYNKLQAVAKEAEPKKAAIIASKAASGLADVALYEGRYKEAARLLEEGISADLSASNKDRAAIKQAILAYTRLQQGQKQQAIATAEKALLNSKNLKTRFLAGLVFAGAEKEDRAKEMITSLAGEVQPEPRSYAKIIEGELAIQQGNPTAAIPLLTDAIASNLLDTWIGRFELGKAYLAAGQFTEAQSEFDRCLERRGEAMALFLDESPTYGFSPPLHYYMGRTLEGMKSSGAAEHFRTYLSIREKAGEDPLIAEARKRVQ